MSPEPAAISECRAQGFTIMEVLVAVLLISMVIGSIMSMNAQAIHTLHATRQVSAASQVLQQRIEMIRSRPWPEISNAAALSQLLLTATESERELSDSAMTERIEVSVPGLSPGGALEPGTPFKLHRHDGLVAVDEPGDFGPELALLFESSITWRDVNGVHQRLLRTVVCRAGLTRSGIFGSALGRPTADPMDR